MDLKSNKNMRKTAVVYWPFSVFRDVHLKKDVGSIPLSFRKEDYETTLIVGEFLANGISGVNVYETRNSHHKIMNPLAQASEFIKVTRKLFELSPNIVIAYNRNPLFPIITALYRFRNIFKFKKWYKTKFIVKMDFGGDFRFTYFSSRFLQDLNLLKALHFSVIVMLKMNYFLSDYISMESECGLSTIQKLLGKSEKLSVIPNGCDLGYYVGNQIESDKENIILSVSRVVKQKSLETLIEAFGQINMNFPEWSVKIVGEIEDTNYYEKLSNLIKKIEIDNRIIFTGAISEHKLLKLYLKSAIFCLPSNWEVDSISRREAIAAGLPVITTEAGCGRSLEKYGSIVVPIGDSTALALGLARLMSDANLRKEISATQMAAVVSWDDVVERYINL